jgi:hypothetical protein
MQLHPSDVRHPVVHSAAPPGSVSSHSFTPAELEEFQAVRQQQLCSFVEEIDSSSDMSSITVNQSVDEQPGDEIASLCDASSPPPQQLRLDPSSDRPQFDRQAPLIADETEEEAPDNDPSELEEGIAVLAIRCVVPKGNPKASGQCWSWQLEEGRPYLPSLADANGDVPLLIAFQNSPYADQVKDAFDNPGTKVKMRPGAITRSQSAGGLGKAPRPIVKSKRQWVTNIRPHRQAIGMKCVPMAVANGLTRSFDDTELHIEPSTRTSTYITYEDGIKVKKEHSLVVKSGSFPSYFDFIVAQCIDGRALIQDISQVLQTRGSMARLNKIAKKARNLSHSHQLTWLINAKGTFVCQFKLHVITIINGLLYETDPSFPFAINLRAGPIDEALLYLKSEMGIVNMSVVRELKLQSELVKENAPGRSNNCHYNNVDKRQLSSPSAHMRFKLRVWDPLSWPAGRNPQEVEAAAVAVEDSGVVMVVNSKVATLTKSIGPGSSKAKMEAIWTLLNVKAGSEQSKRLMMGDSLHVILQLFEQFKLQMAKGMFASDADADEPTQQKMRRKTVNHAVAITLMIRDELPNLLDAGELDRTKVHTCAVQVMDAMVRSKYKYKHESIHYLSTLLSPS